MVGERLNNDRSLELDEVVRRFAEAETLLNQTGRHLMSLRAAEKTSEARAQSLSETARAVEDYSASAKALLDQATQHVRLADEILRAGAKLLDSPILAELAVTANGLDEQISALREAQSTAQAEAQREIAALREAQSRARQEAKRDISKMTSFLRRSIPESHAKHSRGLWLATGALLLGQVATLVVIVAVMSSS